MSKKDHEIIHVNKSFNKYLVTGRPKNHQVYETQEKLVSGLPSQNQKTFETQRNNVNHKRHETHSRNVKRMVGWSIPPTVKFTVTPIPKYRIG